MSYVRHRKRVARTLAQQIAAMSPSLWLRAGVGYTLVAGSGVSVWANQGTLAANAEGPTDSEPIVVPAGSPEMNGIVCPHCDTADVRQFLVELEADTWDPLHNGSGASLFMWVNADGTASTTSRVLSTMNVGDAGLRVYFDQANEHMGFEIVDGAAGTPIQYESADATVPTGEIVPVECRWQKGRTPAEYDFRFGDVTTSGDGGAWDETGGASTDLNLGGSATSPFDGFLGDVLFFDRFVSDAERDVIRAYGARKFGL